MYGEREKEDVCSVNYLVLSCILYLPATINACRPVKQIFVGSICLFLLSFPAIDARILF